MSKRAFRELLDARGGKPAPKRDVIRRLPAASTPTPPAVRTQEPAPALKLDAPPSELETVEERTYRIAFTATGDDVDALKRLQDLLLGHFVGLDELHASAWAGQETAAVESAATSELGGAVIVMRMSERRSAGTFEALNVFMADRDSDEVLLYGFDSFGYRPEPPARGRFVGDELELTRASVRGESRTSFAATADGFTWAKQFRPSADQPWQPVVTGALRRSAATGSAASDESD